MEVPPVDEGGGVRDNRVEVTVVELVAAELGPSVLAAGDVDGLETDAVLQDEHVGVEAQLPLRVDHLPGDDDLKAKVDLAVALGDVSEAGRHDGGVDDLVRDHLAGLIVLDGLHQDERLALLTGHRDGVAAPKGYRAALLGNLIAGDGKAGSELEGLHGLKTRRRTAAGKARGREGKDA